MNNTGLQNWSLFLKVKHSVEGQKITFLNINKLKTITNYNSFTKTHSVHN